ncbi:MAG: nitrous oxide reductase family maturation protein NosD [Pseudobacter sp.]|uniref:nitrous oxide reductase family maturation protein NosD n=1 Tax=Pseudobacter sp. TaxID=2045420 RepID=UPI003F7F4C51
MRSINKIICATAFVFITSGLMAAVIRVSPGGPVRSIKQAIIQAKAGDTILVNAGLYREYNIGIDKPLTLRGIGYPVIDGEKKQEIINIKSNNVLLEGFLVQHSGYSSYNDIAAIRIINARNVIIRNNKLDDTFFGIYSQHSNNCVISGNILRSYAKTELASANGIHCWKSDSMQILNNEITGHRDGIYFEFVTNSIIRNNRSHDNLRYGLHFMFSNNDLYEQNRFERNGAGVAVMFSKKVTMLQNIFHSNWGAAAYGILLKEISDSHIERNEFTRNTTGIYMEGTTRIMVSRNNFNGNGYALRVQASCSDNTIQQNNFSGNTFDVATNGSLVLNSFNSNYWDKYEGYDLNRDGTGDVPFRPVSMYSMVVERNPTAMMLFRSFLVNLFDKSEKLLPALTPENLKDDQPRMRSLKF